MASEYGLFFLIFFIFCGTPAGFSAAVIPPYKPPQTDKKPKNGRKSIQNGIKRSP
jgi:hypothetical protein